MTNNDDKKPQKATADDVARIAEVSKWTVLRAFKPGASISPEAREKVMAAANELGFRPNLLARGLKQSKTNIVGIVADEFSNPHTLRMLKEVTQQLNQRGYMSMLLNIESAENYDSVLQMASQLQVDGLIYFATIVSEEFLTITKSLHHIKAVHVFRNTNAADVEVVNMDGFAAGKRLSELLMEQKYQRYGYMKGPDTSSSHLMRMEGYATGLEEGGQQLDTVIVAGSYARDRGYEEMLQYLRTTPASQRIDALFCENDVLAFGAMQAVRDFDPQLHIGVVGFDDIDEARTSTWNLTSWNQRADLQISEALSRLLDNKPGADQRWKTGELHARQSHIKI